MGACIGWVVSGYIFNSGWVVVIQVYIQSSSRVEGNIQSICIKWCSESFIGGVGGVLRNDVCVIQVWVTCLYVC